MDREMKEEWEAWGLVVRDWAGDINSKKNQPVFDSIKLWGEKLAALRCNQSDEVRTRALKMAEEAYAKSHGHN